MCCAGHHTVSPLTVGLCSICRTLAIYSQEMELELMNADITTLQQQQLMEDTVVQSTTDTALQAENGKLTYQLNHLKRVTAI